jgi:hypothetical protein
MEAYEKALDSLKNRFGNPTESLTDNYSYGWRFLSANRSTGLKNPQWQEIEYRASVVLLFPTLAQYQRSNKLYNVLPVLSQNNARSHTGFELVINLNDTQLGALLITDYKEQLAKYGFKHVLGCISFTLNGAIELEQIRLEDCSDVYDNLWYNYIQQLKDTFDALLAEIRDDIVSRSQNES